MYTIINKIKLTNSDVMLDDKEQLTFEISRPFPYSKELAVACKLPCFSHNIGYCKSVKKAEELITDYYNSNYDKLLQLKKLGNLRCELSKKISNGEIMEISSIINEQIAGKFPLVCDIYLRDTEYELFRVANRA